MSQSMALLEYLEEAGHRVEAVFVGCSSRAPVPDYYRECFRGRMHCIQSPCLIRSHNRKGILVGRTILHNLSRLFLYLGEVGRIREKIRDIRPDIVFNFYDPVGALALRKTDPEIVRIGIGHHFFLHLDGYRCNGGPVIHRWLLKLLTGVIMRSCDRVLALSLRETEGNGRIEVIPPLIRREFRETRHTPGEKYLVYLLAEGYAYDLLIMARADPGFRADVFTAAVPAIDMPPGLQVHSPDDAGFRQKMASCRGLIATSGFDTVAEAAYLGIPMIVVPLRNHFEQLCNSMDAERVGFGHAVKQLVPGVEKGMKKYDNRRYRQWVDSAGEKIPGILGTGMDLKS
jgi:uncharacterized protein (TIGR00661 family)